MTHAAKRLGTVLAAILALGALAASPAWGAEEFHSEKEKAVLTGEQQAVEGTQVWEFEGGSKVECSTLRFQGTVTGRQTAEGLYTSPSITFGPEYSGSPQTGKMGSKCDSFLGAETVEVHTGSCHYRLSSETVREGHALVTWLCPKSESLTIEGAGLTLKITGGPENPFGGVEVNKNLTGVNYTNIGAGSTRDVTVNWTVSGIHYTCEPEFTCSLAGVSSTGTSAKYIGRSTAKGFEDLGGPGAETKGYTEGFQVGIWRE